MALTRALAPLPPGDPFRDAFRDPFLGDPGCCRKRATLNPPQLVTVGIAL
jgi:hypothetical protein